jgi:hypothetical protein
MNFPDVPKAETVRSRLHSKSKNVAKFGDGGVKVLTGSVFDLCVGDSCRWYHLDLVYTPESSLCLRGESGMEPESTSPSTMSLRA